LCAENPYPVGGKTAENAAGYHPEADGDRARPLPTPFPRRLPVLAHHSPPSHVLPFLPLLRRRRPTMSSLLFFFSPDALRSVWLASFLSFRSLHFGECPYIAGSADDPADNSATYIQLTADLGLSFPLAGHVDDACVAFRVVRLRRAHDSVLLYFPFFAGG